MPKAILEFRWDREEIDEKHDYMAAVHGPAMAQVLTSFFQELRKDWKYSEDDKRAELAEEYKDKLWELLTDYGVPLDDLQGY